MAWRGFLKTGWISLLAAVIILTGCGTGSDTKNAAEKQSAETNASNTATNAAATQEENRVVVDQSGEVEIPAHPKRISALYREDFLVALGVTPIVQYFNPMWGKQDYLELNVPLFDITGNIEGMLAAEPDLIIAAGEEPSQYEQYKKIAPTYILSSDVLADSRKTLTVIADLLGMQDKGVQVLQEYDSRIAEVKTKLKAAVGEEKVVVLRMNVVDKSINIFGVENFFIGQILYKDLGLKAPTFVEAMTEPNILLSLEVIPELDADHIILLPSNGSWEDEGNAKALESMLASPLWKTVSAVKQGHVYPVERSFWQTGAIMANYKKMDDLLRLLAPSNT